MNEPAEYRTYEIAIDPESGTPVVVISAMDGGIHKARYIDGELIEETFLPGPWVA